MRTAISAAVIKGDKILLARKGNVWILPEGNLNMENLMKNVYAGKLEKNFLELDCIMLDTIEISAEGLHIEETS